MCICYFRGNGLWELLCPRRMLTWADFCSPPPCIRLKCRDCRLPSGLCPSAFESRMSIAKTSEDLLVMQRRQILAHTNPICMWPSLIILMASLLLIEAVSLFVPFGAGLTFLILIDSSVGVRPAAFFKASLTSVLVVTPSSPVMSRSSYFTSPRTVDPRLVYL